MSDVLAASTVQALDVGGALDNAFRSVVAFVPKFVAFLVILLIGWFVARLLRTVVDKGLDKLHFDRAVQRSGMADTMQRSRIDASDLIARIVYYGVLLMALQLAFGVWGPNPVSALLNDIVAWLPRAIVAIIIVVVAAALASAVRDIVTRSLAGMNYGPMLGRLASWFVIALGVIAALNQIGVATTVTMPVLITVLATAGGIAVIGLGGGMVRPMERRWERWLGRAEAEIPGVKAQQEAYQRGREDAARAGAPAAEPATARDEAYVGAQHAETTRMDTPTPPSGQPMPPTTGQPGRWEPRGRPTGGPDQPS